MVTRKNIVQDGFTARLIAVFTALTEKEAFAKKKDFAEPCELSLVELNQIERHLRNYPKDELRRKRCIINLYERFGVNPEYMNEKSKTMFLREPEKVTRAVSLETVQLNFDNKKEKQQLIAERDYYKRLYEELAERQGIAAEPFSEYITGKNMDKNPDKTGAKE
jgi:hypothetical protein